MGSRKIFGVLLLGLLVAVIAQGCTALAYQDIQRRHETAALRGVVLQGARGPVAGAGFDLAAILDPATTWSWTDIGEQAVGVASDIAVGIIAYNQTKGSSSSPTLPASITTGNNSPVQIVVGSPSGPTTQHNPNITTTSTSTAAQRR